MFTKRLAENSDFEKQNIKYCQYVKIIKETSLLLPSIKHKQNHLKKNL